MLIYIQGAPKVLAPSDIFADKCNWLTYIQQQLKTATGNHKPHPFLNPSFDVVAPGGDSGLDARTEVLVGSDDVRRLQCPPPPPPRHYDPRLEQLQTGMRSGLDLILQNSAHAVIERVEVGRLRQHIFRRR